VRAREKDESPERGRVPKRHLVPQHDAGLDAMGSRAEGRSPEGCADSGRPRPRVAGDYNPRGPQSGGPREASMTPGVFARTHTR